MIHFKAHYFTAHVILQWPSAGTTAEMTHDVCGKNATNDDDENNSHKDTSFQRAQWRKLRKIAHFNDDVIDGN